MGNHKKKKVRSFSKMVQKVEDSLRLSPGHIIENISYPWGSPEACQELDQTAGGMASMLWKLHEMEETDLFLLAESCPEANAEVQKIVDSLAFVYTLLLQTERRSRSTTHTFAQRDPQAFIAWTKEREEACKQSRLRLVK